MAGIITIVFFLFFLFFFIIVILALYSAQKYAYKCYKELLGFKKDIRQISKNIESISGFVVDEKARREKVAHNAKIKRLASTMKEDPGFTHQGIDRPRK